MSLFSLSTFLKFSTAWSGARGHFRHIAIPATKNKNRYQVIVAGGGTAGCAVAARLRDVFPVGAIGVIEPNIYHYYQPGWTLVGAGITGLEETRIPTEKAIPTNAEWIKDSIIAFDPLNNKVIVSEGREITYDYLIICLGLTLRFDMIQGAKVALDEDPRVCTNFCPEYVEKTFKAMRHFDHGTALFTFPITPIKCAGAPLKVMYLFEDYLVRNGRRKGAEIDYFTALKTLFSVKKFANVLQDICRQREIVTFLGQNLVEVDRCKSIAVFEDVETKKRKEYKYDFLHITPPMTAPEVLKTGVDLTSPAMNNFAHVDPHTLRHVKYSNIFSLGDCSSLPTSRTAAAISSESKVLCENLADVVSGGSGNISKYDGYTSCPLLTGYNKGLLAEFDYDLNVIQTCPFDQSRERAFFAWVKRAFLPPLYWNGLIRGTWGGPAKLRTILHLGMVRRRK